MAAIEYGSDYWCVILNGGGDGSKLASIRLHADAMKIDSGALVFTSAGRREYAANLKDGSPVSVEHWEGNRDGEAAVRDKAAHY